MAIELVRTKDLIQFLKDNGEQAPTLGDVMRHRIDTPVIDAPVIEALNNLWRLALFSKTFYLTGGLNDEGFLQYKVDHSPDLARILESPDLIPSGLGIRFSSREVYDQSEGTPFVVIPGNLIKGAISDYAIHATNGYPQLVDYLKLGKLWVSAIEESGGFKVNIAQWPDDIVSVTKYGNFGRVNPGWVELAVGKNKASPDDYRAARHTVLAYLDLAFNNLAFDNDNSGMAIFVPGVAGQNGDADQNIYRGFILELGSHSWSHAVMGKFKDERATFIMPKYTGKE